jgi:chromosomal replication initiation ATPase DnaA
MNATRTEQIIYDICKHFNVGPAELLQPGTGLHYLHLPRQLAMYLCYHTAGCNYVQAAKAMNRKTSKSAFNACLNIEKKIREGDETVLNFLKRYRYCRHLVEGREAA